MSRQDCVYVLDTRRFIRESEGFLRDGDIDKLEFLGRIGQSPHPPGYTSNPHKWAVFHTLQEARAAAERPEYKRRYGARSSAIAYNQVVPFKLPLAVYAKAQLLYRGEPT